METFEIGWASILPGSAGGLLLALLPALGYVLSGLISEGTVLADINFYWFN
jgi:hypothetical protein